MATNNHSSSFFIFHAGKILQINCATLNHSISQPEIYEIDFPKFSTIYSSDPQNNGTIKRKIEETSCCAPSEWKKLKIYDERNFVPLEIGFLLNQKDLFYEIISWINVESILKSLRCVCKTWNNWIMIDFDELWKNRYEKMCNFEFSEDLLKNCQQSFLFNCHILESAMKKHAQFEDIERLDLHFLQYEFSKDPVYAKIKKILQPRLFVLNVENHSKYIGRETVTDINITSLLNLGEYGFVKFNFKYFQFSPKNGEPTKDITVKYKLILNNSIVEGKKESFLHVLESYHDHYSDPVVKRNDELIAQIMSAIGIDRNLIRAFLMLVTFDFAFDYCGVDLYKSDYYLSLVGGSEKYYIEQ